MLPTTVAEPGGPQARAALDHGADLVVVIGGDGTLRQVAHELVGHDAALGIVPVGTANLFARNLLLAPRPLAESVRIALHGDRARVDAGLATITTRHGSHRATFLVLAGIGHDALTVQRVPEVFKRHLGWLGYFGPAALTVRRRPTRMMVRLDDADPMVLEAWSVLAVNCGRIPGGVRITRGSLADDGLLETLVVTASSARQWAGIAVKGLLDLPYDVPGLQQDAARRLRVLPDHAQPMQLDGDVERAVTAVDFEIRPAALTVVVPPREGRGVTTQNSPVAGSRSVTQ